MKTCSKCGLSKDIDEFGKDRATSDGLHRWCKVCNRESAKKWRRANPEKNKSYIEQWRKNNRDRINETSKKWCRANPEKIRQIYIKTKEKFPIRNDARKKVAYAIKMRRLIKHPCQICNSTKNINAHHPDYSKPLEVIWLCSKHHAQVHSGRLLI